MSKVSESRRPAIAISVKTLEAEQTLVAKQRALRLFCRAMIRLYLQHNSKSRNGKRLGVL